MERLISLREFIVEPKHWKDTEHFDNHDVLSLIISYANFLSQPLTISMFVPCDEEGNVLSEPNIRNHEHRQDSFAFRSLEQQYNAAKEKVLFEGFREFTDVHGMRYISFESEFNGECIAFHWNQNKWQRATGKETIEQLVRFNPVLSGTAKKQIVG